MSLIARFLKLHLRTTETDEDPSFFDPARSHSLASAVKPHRSRMSVVSLRHHRPTAEDTPIPLRLRSSSLITSPASPFSKRSLTPPQLKRVNSLPGV